MNDNGSVVAHFNSLSLVYSFVRRSLSLENDKGDLIASLAADLTQKKGMASKVIVSTFGINLNHIETSCVSIKEP